MSRFRTLVCGIALAVSLPLLAGGWFTEATAAQLTLTWAETSDSEVGFLIERATGGTGVFAEVAEAGATSWPSRMSGCWTERRTAIASGLQRGHVLGLLRECLRDDRHVRGPRGRENWRGQRYGHQRAAGITCGGSCSSTTPRALRSPSPQTRSRITFSGWSGGGCSGTGTCSVTLNATITVMATFSLQSVALTINKAGSAPSPVRRPGSIAVGPVPPISPSTPA